MRKKQKTRFGFTVLEAVISVLLVMLFVLSVIIFFSLQNRNIHSFLNQLATQDLADEAQEYIKTIGYSQLQPGFSYVLDREITPGTGGSDDSWKYSLNNLGGIGQYDTSAYADGEYLKDDSLSISQESFARMQDGFFRRIIDVTELIDPFQVQKNRLITIKVWSDDCNIEDIDNPCFTRQFIVSDQLKYE